MSVIFSNEDGWIVSHLQYLNDVYKTVNNEQKLCMFKFNELLFNINSQYFPQNRIDNFIEGESGTLRSKTRKRKRPKLLSPDDAEQTNHIKQALARILFSARSKGCFSNSVACDYNKVARAVSRQFYSDTFRCSAENLRGCNESDVAVVSEIWRERYVFPAKCNFFQYDVRDMPKIMKMNNQFDLVLLDPPWWNKSIRRKKGKCVEASYKMMSNEVLIKIPIDKLSSSNGVVAVWCTNAPSHLRCICDEMFPAWGVTYRAKWYWVKVTQSGETICDFNPLPGKRPYELLVLGSVSSSDAMNIPDGKLIVSVPSAVHSHKPPVTELVAPYLPSRPNCLEIFARYVLPGWTSWGLEVLKFQHLSLYTIIEHAMQERENLKS